MENSGGRNRPARHKLRFTFLEAGGYTPAYQVWGTCQRFLKKVQFGTRWPMEDMMKLSVILLTALFVGVAFAGQASPSTNRDQSEKAAPADAKESRWQGHIVRINKDQSSLSVRGGQGNMESTERLIFYDDSTQWTAQGKPAEQGEFKEGSFVIVLGHPDEKGVFHASRIDLRLPR